MKIYYNITGQKRRSLADSISKELNLSVKYLGAPTFSYEVGVYHIDKEGTLTGKDNLDLEVILRDKHGFQAMRSEYFAPDLKGSGLSGLSAMLNTIEFNHETELWAESEMRRLKLESANVPDYSNRGQYGGDELSDLIDPKTIEEAGRLVIEIPLNDFTEESISNLEKLIASKTNLIKKAIEADALTIERTEDVLRFPWFKLPADNEVVAAYSQFIASLCVAAMRQKRITAKEKDTDNEKYAFRCFLLRIGFIGDDYKSARKILLSRLDGNSAFKTTKSTAEVI